MTFLSMLQACADDLGYTTSPSTDQTTRLKRWMNEGYRHVLAQPGMEQLRDATFTLTTVANQAVYALPMAVNAVLNITQATNSQRLRMMTRDTYRSINAGLNQTGSPADAWVPWGWGPVILQPSSTGLWAASTAAGDVTQTFAVNGVRSTGDLAAPVTASAVLNGTTRVQLGSLTDYIEITTLAMSAAATGTVVVWDAAVSGNIVLRLQPGQTSAQYQQVALFPTPSAAINYTVDAQMQVPDLVGNMEIPLLPPDFHDMIPLYARMREYHRVGDTGRSNEAKQEWVRRMADLRMNVHFPKDYQPKSGGIGDGLGWNNLGPWYPADVRF